MFKGLNKYGFVLCGAVLLHAGVPDARAQSLGLTPAEVQYAFKPGQPFQFEIAVSNGGSKTQVMRASITDLWYNEKNEKLFNPPGSSPRSAANWMEVVPPQITGTRRRYRQSQSGRHSAGRGIRRVLRRRISGIET